MVVFPGGHLPFSIASVTAIAETPQRRQCHKSKLNSDKVHPEFQLHSNFDKPKIFSLQFGFWFLSSRILINRLELKGMLVCILSDIK